MKRALIYPRVSSDEQADKGYSLRDQEEKLLVWCQGNNRLPLATFREDYSAWKGFDRPQWNQILAYLKANRGLVDEVVFTRWDRFSRNAPEAYNMIDTLRSLGVIPVAIEQPIDLSVPENKMMLAFYLALPEVENDRRSMNTIAGLRRAKSEGRFAAGRAPIGYLNAKDDQKRNIIVPDPNRRHLIQEIFESYVAGKSLFEIHREVAVKGFTQRHRSAIKSVLTSYVYIGMVQLKAYGDQQERLVKGIHEAIISEDLFWAANARLKIEDKKAGRIITDELPMRGVLFCECCGNLLTGSRSRGKSGRYFWYYRCYKGCKGENYYGKRVESHLLEMLGSMSIGSSDLQDIIAMVEGDLEKQMVDQRKTLSLLNEQRESLKKKINSWMDKYAGEKISHEEYVEMKLRFTHELTTCEAQIQRLSQDEDQVWRQYKKALPLLSDMQYVWNKGELADKQQLLRALFPGSLSYQMSRGCNSSHKPFATPYLFEPFASNLDSIKNLRLRNGSRVVPISGGSPVRVHHRTGLEPTGSEFNQFLSTVSKICA